MVAEGPVTTGDVVLVLVVVGAVVGLVVGLVVVVPPDVLTVEVIVSVYVLVTKIGVGSWPTYVVRKVWKDAKLEAEQ